MREQALVGSLILIVHQFLCIVFGQAHRVGLRDRELCIHTIDR